MYFSELSTNQLRVSVDLRQTYDALRAAQRTALRYAGGLSWKTVGGRDYLIKVIDRRGGTKSLGPRSPETEAIHAEFVAGKARSRPGVRSWNRAYASFPQWPVRCLSTACRPW